MNMTRLFSGRSFSGRFRRACTVRKMRYAVKKVVFVAVIAVLTVIPLLSQPPPAQKPSFDVTSVKRTGVDATGRGMNMRGDRFVATGATLKTLVQFAYSKPGNPLFNYQIIGAPN